jgi:two-component system response regulator PilR (NtrC family)
MESEFFGYTKGSFSGATTDKAGLFEAASGGTLFLDEVAELPLSMQVKLLRALQEKAIRPVGSPREVSVDVRVVSASHKDLNALVQHDLFRHDLFYRINVVQIDVPSLRMRSEDIPLLSDNILAKFRQQWGMGNIHITDTAMAALQTYQFPGNVRELENILERALTLADDDTIDVEDLQLPDPGLVSAPVETKNEQTTTNMLPSPEADPLPLDLEKHLDTVEYAILEQALKESRWNITEAAKLVGLSFRQMRYRLKKHQLS